ncbi:MAG: hypothetical protein RIR00_61 [Pseudomonadota bacterium]
MIITLLEKSWIVSCSLELNVEIPRHTTYLSNTAYQKNLAMH